MLARLAEFEKKEQAANAEQELAIQGLKAEIEELKEELQKSHLEQVGMDLVLKENAMLKEDRQKYRTMLRQHGIAIPPNTTE